MLTDTLAATDPPPSKKRKIYKNLKIVKFSL